MGKLETQDNENSQESMRVTLAKIPGKGDVEPEMYSCNQAGLPKEGFGHQPSHKIFNLQHVLLIRCGGINVAQKLWNWSSLTHDMRGSPPLTLPEGWQKKINKIIPNAILLFYYTHRLVIRGIVTREDHLATDQNRCRDPLSNIR